MEFEKELYAVLEEDGKVVINVLRSGNLSEETKIYVVTKPGSATSPEDFKKLEMAPQSIVEFKSGDD